MVIYRFLVKVANSRLGDSWGFGGGPLWGTDLFEKLISAGYSAITPPSKTAIYSKVWRSVRILGDLHLEDHNGMGRIKISINQ